VVAVSFSSDGKLLASGSYDTTVILWDVANRKMIRKFEPSEGKTYSVAFSPDDALLASGHVGGEIKLWDVASGKLVRSFKSDAYAVESLAFTPDGHLLAARSSFTVDLWDVAAGAVAHSLKGAAALISFASMAMSPDGKKIVTGDTDGSIRVWDVAEGKQLQELEAHVKPVDTVAFSPDGSLIASASDDKTVKLWSLGRIMSAGR
jgi:WD40 repeat protein